MSYYELIPVLEKMTAVKSEQDFCTLNVFTESLH